MAADDFTQREQRALSALAAQIIPASAEFGQPAANDPAILADILNTAAPVRARLVAALATLGDGTALDADRAADFRCAHPQAAEIIQTVVAQCYYRDARVMTALDIELRAPFPEGYTQEPNDFSLLDPVIARGPLFRPVQ